MRVSDIMSTPVVTVDRSAPLSDVISVMLLSKISCVPVVDPNGMVVGILSEGDLMRRVELGTVDLKTSWWSRLFMSCSPTEVYHRAHDRKVSDLMTRGAITVESTDTVADAARLMHHFKIKRLPVLADRKLVGMLTRGDFMKALNNFLAPACEGAVVSDDEIKNRIAGEVARQDWSRPAI